MEGSLELMGIGCSFERLKYGLELREVNIPGGWISGREKVSRDPGIECLMNMREYDAA